MSDEAYRQLQNTKSGQRLARLWQLLRFYTSANGGNDVSAMRTDNELTRLVQASQDAETVTKKKLTLRKVLDHVAENHGVTEEVLNSIPNWDMIQFFRRAS